MFPTWIQNVILYGFGIIGHETAHLRGHGELHAYGLMQILPAFFGSFMLGGIAIRLGASPFVITLSGMLGAALAVGLLSFYYVMEFMYLGAAKRAAGSIENKMILNIVFYMSGIRPREKADHLIAEVESHLAEAPNKEELEEALQSMMKTLKDLPLNDLAVGEALYYLLMISNKERVPEIVKKLQSLIKNLDTFFKSRGDIWNIVQPLLRENREDVEEVIPLFGVIANNLNQENIADYFIWRILKEISSVSLVQLQELTSRKTAEAYRKFIQKVSKGNEESGLPSGYYYSGSVLVAISCLPEPAKRALELVNENERYERPHRFLKRFLTGESDLAEVYFKLPENVEDYFSLEALAAVIFIDEYQFRDQTEFDLHRAKDYFSYYAQDPELVQIRYLLYSQQYEELKELIVKRRISDEQIMKAILFNHQTEIMVQTSDLILRHAGTKGILNGMTPLADKVSSRVFTAESVLPMFSYLGSSMDEKRLSGLLLQLGYQLYFHKGNRLIIPRVYDHLVSAFRGSAEYDHVEASYLTHALTTAILHYARKKGEAKFGGLAYGANAFHEFDLLMMMLEGRNNREVDPAVSLSFHYQGLPLPEYARKRTVSLHEMAAREIIQRLLDWQLKERSAKQNIFKILKWIEMGELSREELNSVITQWKVQLGILENQCGLKKEYWHAMFGHLDDKFFKELAKRYRPGKNNRKSLRRILLGASKNVTVAINYDREGHPKITVNHPFNEIKIIYTKVFPLLKIKPKQTLLDYLELEASLRVGTFDNQDVSTIKWNKAKTSDRDIPAAIFYPFYMKGRIENPKNWGDKIYNVLYWLGEPKVIAPFWEELLFRAIPIFLSHTALSSLATVDPVGLGMALGVSIGFFSFAHTIVRWFVRSHDTGRNQEYLPLKHVGNGYLHTFVKQLFRGLILTALYLVSLNFLPIPSSVLSHLVSYVIVVVAHGAYNTAVLKGLVTEWLNFTNLSPLPNKEKKVEEDIDQVVKETLLPLAYSSYKTNRVYLERSRKTALQKRYKNQQSPLFLIDLEEQVMEGEGGFDLPQYVGDWVEGLVHAILLHPYENNQSIPAIAIVLQSQHREQISQLLIEKWNIPKDMLLFTARTPDDAVKKAKEKNVTIVSIFTKRPEVWGNLAKWIVTFMKGDELRIQGQELNMFRELFKGKIGIGRNELVIPKESLGLEGSEDYFRQTIHFKLQA